MKTDKRKALGTYDIGKICHVAPITVGRWIDEGKLPFFTTGGGHRRVWSDDVVTFLKAHNYPVPKHLTPSTRTAILVVEDNAAMRRVIRRTLEKEFPSVRIYEAIDGYEAGESVLTLTPALVILDIFLPGIDGVSVCQRIRANKALKDTRILAITGEPSQKTKEKILKAGADAFLSKPFDLPAFQKIVARLINVN